MHVKKLLETEGLLYKTLCTEIQKAGYWDVIRVVKKPGILEKTHRPFGLIG